MLLNRVAFCFKDLKKNQFVLLNKVIDTINLMRRYHKKNNRSIFCVCEFLFSSFFATFDFTLLINKMLYLKN